MKPGIPLTVSILCMCASATAQVTLPPTFLALHTTGAIAGSDSTTATSGLPNDAISAAAGLGDVVTQLQGSTSVEPDEIAYRIRHQVGIAPIAVTPAAGICGTDARIELALQSTQGIHCSVAATFEAPAGTASPTVRVDFGADGIVEFVGLGSLEFVLPASAGILSVRIEATTVASLPGDALLDLTVRLTPADASILPQVLGCDYGFFDSLRVQSRLDHGIEFAALPSGQDPVVLVLGLNAAPVLLPTVSALPCVVWPTPDVVQLMPIASGGPNYVLALPSALRPVTFYAQGVRVTAGGLQTTSAWRVEAF